MHKQLTKEDICKVSVNVRVPCWGLKVSLLLLQNIDDILHVAYNSDILPEIHLSSSKHHTALSDFNLLDKKWMRIIDMKCQSKTDFTALQPKICYKFWHFLFLISCS